METESEEKKESNPHARVILTVKDVNDNSPKFKKLFYSFQIKDSLGFHELVHPVSVRYIINHIYQPLRSSRIWPKVNFF